WRWTTCSRTGARCARLPWRCGAPGRSRSPVWCSPASPSGSRSTPAHKVPGRMGCGGKPPLTRKPPDHHVTATPVAPLATPLAELGVPAALGNALAEQGILEPFAVQALCIPPALEGRDVCGKAKTGSGKTLAFGIPLLLRAGTGASRRPRGLVLVPTRELALQVHDVLAPLAKAMGTRVVALYGGAPMDRQVAHLRAGADVVVATPGRLIDLSERR